MRCRHGICWAFAIFSPIDGKMRRRPSNLSGRRNRATFPTCMYLATRHIARGWRNWTTRAAEELVKVGNDSPEYHLFAGKYHLNRQEYEPAIAQFETAAKANPRLPFVHFNLGMAYMGKQNYPRAREEFLKDVAVEPDLALNYEATRGSLLADAGRQQRREELSGSAAAGSATGERVPGAGQDLSAAAEICGRAGGDRRRAESRSGAHRRALHAGTSAAPLGSQRRSEEGNGGRWRLRRAAERTPACPRPNCCRILSDKLAMPQISFAYDRTLPHLAGGRIMKTIFKIVGIIIAVLIVARHRSSLLYRRQHFPSEAGIGTDRRFGAAGESRAICPFRCFRAAWRRTTSRSRTIRSSASRRLFRRNR